MEKVLVNILNKDFEKLQSYFDAFQRQSYLVALVKENSNDEDGIRTRDIKL